MAYVVAEPCIDVKDRGCLDECPVDAIYEGPKGTYINPAECIDCGACAAACPAQAIYFEGDLPEKWRGYIKVNVEFFQLTGLGAAAGGYGKVGQQAVDHPLVEEYVASH